MKLIKFKSRAYPDLLRQIAVPPKALYTEGDLAALNRVCVAIVGTRRSTPYGEAMAFALGKELARAGVCVVSGLAFGIDGAAHRGALAGGGVTAAVVAQALPDLLPVKHRSLAREIVDKGGVILSEKAPGELCYKGDYLVRNRIVSGLSKAIIVVEAGFPSGALNTASHALAQGREVFAVPGRVSDPMSAGCNELLHNGAQLARSPTEVLHALRIEAAAPVPTALEGLEAKLVSVLQKEALHVGELAELAGVGLGELYEALSNLELRGVLWKAADERYTVQ